MLCGWRRKAKYWLDVNIRKTQPRETRAERLSDVLRSGARYFYQRSKDNFVIGIGECVRGEALDDFGARLLFLRGGAKRREEPPLDFRRR